MPDVLPPGAVVVVTGVPAAGKSTVAEALARRAALGVHVHGDAFRRWVVAGRSDMVPDPPAEALRQLHLRYASLLTVEGTVDAILERLDEALVELPRPPSGLP